MSMHSSALLTLRLQRITKPVAVLVGAPLSTTWRQKPWPPGYQQSAPQGMEWVREGVPDVDGMIDRVRGALGAELRDGFEAELATAGAAGRYQAAFGFAQAVLGPDAVDRIVRAAVLEARLPEAPTDFDDDGDPADWHLPRGTAALGRLVARGQPPFTGPVLTTNFDPLLSLAIRHAGAEVSRRVLDGDGELERVAEREGRRSVVHLHGYWRDAATLHTPAQLQGARPKLAGSLRTLLRGHAVLVVGYGGWDDVFTRTLHAVAAESDSGIEVLWGLFGSKGDAREQNQHLLGPYEQHSRFTFYYGVDAHRLFDELDAAGQASPAVSTPPAARVPAPATAAAPTPAAPSAADEPESPEAEPPTAPDEPDSPGARRPQKPPRSWFAGGGFPATAGTMVGGEALVAELHRLLAGGGEAAIGQAAAVGLGGLGKSRLAWEYAHAHRDHYPGGVIWFDADGQSDLDGQLARIARERGWVGPASDEMGALTVARVELRELTGALIIFDNVEDLAVVRPLRPAGGCAILLTSRAPVPVPVLDMRCLGVDAGVELLRRVSLRTLDAADEVEAAKIVEWADGLPLALELVGGYLARTPGAGWGAVRARLEDHALSARALRPVPGLEEPTRSDRSVDAALTLGAGLFAEFPELGPALDMLSGLAPAPMGRDLLFALVDPADPEGLDEALAVACTLRILDRAPGGEPRYRMHRLVRAVYRAQHPDGGALDEAALERLAVWFRTRRMDRVGTEVFGGEGAHLEAARALADQRGGPTLRATLIWLEAYIPNARGEYQAAREQLAIALGLLDGGAEPSLALEMALDDGCLMLTLGDPLGSVEALEALVPGLEKMQVSAETHITVLQELAVSRNHANRFVEARDAAEQALRFAEATWGEAHWRRARAFLGWAVDEANLDRQRASSLVERAEAAYARLTETRAPSDVQLMSGLNYLAIVLKRARRGPEAIDARRALLSLHQESLGPEHPKTLKTHLALALALNSYGQRAEAGQSAAVAVRGLRRYYAAEHPDVVRARIEQIKSRLGHNREHTTLVITQLKQLRATLPGDHVSRRQINDAINALSPQKPKARGHAKPKKRRRKKRR